MFVSAVIAMLVGALKPLLASEGDTIYHTGEQGRDMYIITSGVLQAVYKGEVKHAAIRIYEFIYICVVQWVYIFLYLSIPRSIYLHIYIDIYVYSW